MVAALAAITTTRALRRTKDMRSRIARSFPPGPSGGPARGTPASRERCTRRRYQGGTGTVLGAAHEKIAQLGIARPTRRPDLVPGAVLRVLVRAEPQEARPVTEALLLHLVEAHLAHELGPHLVPRQIAALRPTPAALGCPSPLALRPQMPLLAERRQQLLELRLQRPRDARGVPDEVERAVLAIEAEEERGDARAARAVADDDAVGGLVVLHLGDGVARPGPVREVEALRDPAVEPDDLQALEPMRRDRGVARDRREPEAGGLALELRAALGEGPLVHGLAAPEEDVERDVGGRRLRGELADPRLRGVQAHLHRVEVESPAELDDDLSVERRVRWKQRSQRAELGEIAEERTAVAAPQGELAAVVLQHAAEAIPLRLVLPAVSCGQLFDELCLHRREPGRWFRHQPLAGPAPTGLPNQRRGGPRTSPAGAQVPHRL